MATRKPTTPVSKPNSNPEKKVDLRSSEIRDQLRAEWNKGSKGRNLDVIQTLLEAGKVKYRKYFASSSELIK